MKNRFMTLMLLSVVMAFGMQLAVADLGEEVSGGGQILNDSYKISFGAYALDGDPNGELQIKFHNVSGDWLDKAKFHGEEIYQMTFFGSDSNTCNAAVNMIVYGSLVGVSGYSVIFRVGDYDAPGHWNPEANAFDTVRIQLFETEVTSTGASGAVYDTYADDFTVDSTCVGKARTKLDRGNLTIEME